MRKKDVAIRDEITELLRDAIFSGELKPRERLVEAELSERYMVSRTPIREAIHNLAAVGLVQLEPYKGAIVADVDVNAVREIYVVRIALEGLATQLAVPLIPDSVFEQLQQLHEQMAHYMEENDLLRFGDCNEEFHSLIYSYCGNKTLKGMIDDLLKRSQVFRRSAWRSDRNLHSTLSGHQKILDALRARDAEKARRAVESHIKIFLRTV